MFFLPDKWFIEDIVAFEKIFNAHLSDNAGWYIGRIMLKATVYIEVFVENPGGMSESLDAWETIPF